MNDAIWTIDDKKEGKFLRRKTQDFDFSKFSKNEIEDLIRRMRRAMKEASGIGLSANQIGLDMKVFVAGVPQANGGMKFYSAFNPRIEKAEGRAVSYEEGCLSVPGKYGMVERPDRVTLIAEDKAGKPIKIKAFGLTARVFQHETDHLNGKLFIDRTTDIHDAAGSERNLP